MLQNRLDWRDYVDKYKADPGQRNPASFEPGTTGGSSGNSAGGNILGWLKKLIPGWGDAADIASSVAQGQADERGNRNNYGDSTNRALATLYGVQQNSALEALLGQGRDRQSAYGTRQGAMTSALANESQENIQRAELGLRAPTARARQSVMGSLMANMQPVEVENSNPRLAGRVPKITGGLTPAALGADTRAHGAELSKAALMAQLTGSDIPAATNFRGGVLDSPEAIDYTRALLLPPELQGYQQPGRMETVASWLSLLRPSTRTKPTSGNGLPIDPTGGG